METIAKLSLGNKRLGDELLKKRHELTNFDCYEPLVDFYNAKCFDLNKVSVNCQQPICTAGLNSLIDVLTGLVYSFPPHSLFPSLLAQLRLHVISKHPRLSPMHSLYHMMVEFATLINIVQPHMLNGITSPSFAVQFFVFIWGM